MSQSLGHQVDDALGMSFGTERRLLGPWLHAQTLDQHVEVAVGSPLTGYRPGEEPMLSGASLEDGRPDPRTAGRLQR